jgi:hypothetical protein
VTTLGKGDVDEEYLVYIQITTADSHTLDIDVLRKLEGIFSSAHDNRVYVALLPENTKVEDFKLKPFSKRRALPVAVPVLVFIGTLVE